MTVVGFSFSSKIYTTNEFETANDSIYETKHVHKQIITSSSPISPFHNKKIDHITCITFCMPSCHLDSVHSHHKLITENTSLLTADK